MAQVQNDNNSNKFFGSYILNTKYIPGREGEVDKQNEEALFEMIDDYVEQA
ncbi:hypothetical protein [Lacrimispora sp.]|jgi:hypothetical protein|uniref:hypothetical protein n=1 Tax=Lacrimispora sp. TaxID=2719234 RepID=UPI0028AA5B6D|nr:hypothetical protein [Lacrimispora sp.]